jgi:hypothetical protein
MISSISNRTRSDKREAVFGAVEHAAHGALLRVRQERCLHGGVLDQQPQAREVPLLRRGGHQAAKRRPDRLLDLRRVGQTLLGEKRHHPVEGVGAALRRVDAGQRLEGGNAIAAEIDRGPAHAEEGGARRAALVEHEDFGAGKATPLQGKEGEQHRLAGAGRADNHGVADIADMKIEPERRRSVRARNGKRRAR